MPLAALALPAKTAQYAAGYRNEERSVKALSYIVAIVLGAALATSALFLVPGVKDGLSPGQARQVEAVLQQYLDAHPEVVGHAIERLQEREKNAALETQRTLVKAHAAAILHDDADPVLGNPQGDVTIVEFFDYRCPYCKRAFPTVMETVRADGHIRLVLKEFPILGPASQAATRAALASIKQGKYEAFHMALLGANTPLENNTVLDIAKSVGLDVKRLADDMGNPEIDAAIKKNFELAAILKIDGTPTFLIGDQLVPGAMDKATLERLVREARGKSKS